MKTSLDTFMVTTNKRMDQLDEAVSSRSSNRMRLNEEMRRSVQDEEMLNIRLPDGTKELSEADD